MGWAGSMIGDFVLRGKAFWIKYSRTVRLELGEEKGLWLIDLHVSGLLLLKYLKAMSLFSPP